jgi:hypothetical protein
MVTEEQLRVTSNRVLLLCTLCKENAVSQVIQVIQALSRRYVKYFDHCYKILSTL